MLIPGASTGINFRAPLEETIATIKSCCPVLEISALRMQELPAAFDAAHSAVEDFQHVSFHLPDKYFSWPNLLAVLLKVPGVIANFIAHPHIVWPEVDPWGELLRSRLLIENLDNRPIAAPFTHKGDKFLDLLGMMPYAGVCLDLAHALSVTPDPDQLLKEIEPYRHRIREFHISYFNERGKHCKLSEQHAWSEAARRVLAEFIVTPEPIPAILETPCANAEELREQLGELAGLLA